MDKPGARSLTPSSGGKTVIIKIGSSSLITLKPTASVYLSVVSNLVEVICTMVSHGHRVILVSSGAVGMGCIQLGLDEKPKQHAMRRGLAAMGQCRLIRIWDDLFSYLGQKVGQIMITRRDLADKSSFNSIKATLNQLLASGVIPIMNENDSVSSEEQFGDNDTMAAHVAACVGADYLFMLTDVDALYDSNPTANPDAKQVTDVHDIDKMTEGVKIGSSGSGTQWGTGGMETKIRAARVAVTAGVRAVITHAHKAQQMLEILEQHRKLDDDPTRTNGYLSDESEGSVGRLGTTFHPIDKPVKESKRWITHGLVMQGAVVVDDGAAKAVVENSTLFAAGIIDVQGDFPRNTGVVVLDAQGDEVARGSSAYSSDELRKCMGLRSAEIQGILGVRMAQAVMDRQSLVPTAAHEGSRMDTPAVPSN